VTTTPKLVKSQAQANTTDGGFLQGEGRIAALPDGGYVTVWTDTSQVYNPSGFAVVGQCFDSAGNKVGGEVNISEFYLGDQLDPAVTALPNGNVAVAFVDSFPNSLISDRDIYVRVYGSALTPSPLRTDVIDISPTVQTYQPALTAFADGSYVVSYTVGVGDTLGSIDDTDIVARIVSPTGVVGPQFDIHNQDDNSGNSQLATLSNGNFVAVYQDEFNGSTTDIDIKYGIFTKTGMPVAVQQAVPGAFGNGLETDPDVAALRDGGFVVVWTDPDSSVTDIRASILSNAGGIIASNVLVNTTTAGAQNEASVVALDDGGFLVSWNDHSADLVRAQRFDAFGGKIGAQVTVKDGESSGDSHEAAVLSDGRIGLALDLISADNDYDVMNSLWTTGLADGHVHDFNGDGNGDILWRNDNGAVGIWELDGGQAIAGASLGVVGPDWHIADTGDFNGDGKSDILWHNDNGATVIWELNGGKVIAAASLGTASPDWHIALTGDFNGDGKSDILWQNDNGATGIWELNGGQVLAAVSLGTASPDWHIADTGDFNGDGNSDILWRNDNGYVSIWELNGGQVLAAAGLGPAGLDWHVAGTGDFNGDGKSDILWHNDNGAVGMWALDGIQVISATSLGSASPDWHIAETGDFNGDDTHDILWRNDNGATSIWQLHGGQVVATASVGNVGTDWHIVM
jgi:hypothetical protein